MHTYMHYDFSIGRQAARQGEGPEQSTLRIQRQNELDEEDEEGRSSKLLCFSGLDESSNAQNHRTTYYQGETRTSLIAFVIQITKSRCKQMMFPKFKF